MMNRHFYITTPIYYVNAEPHIGHAYTTIVADVMNRFHRLIGDSTYFLTGTDEHGDKIVQAAQEAGEDPRSYVDRISRLFRETWPKLHIATDDFIRTTEARHVRVVQQVLQKVYDAGDIYFDRYKGLYCVGCERFYTQRELVDGKCPDHDLEPVEREEANYFFRMGKYQQWLVEHIETHADFIRPERYRNEVLGFLREPLEDLCVSRPRERLSWGVPLPFDANYVTYVWFDALINYISALDYPDGVRFRQFWPAVQHLIAKDILKPHAIYWPTMLRAAGLPPYRHLNVHGYWKIHEGKMSKSRGTVVRPLDQAAVYGADAFRYFLLREMVFGLDANFNEEALVTRLNADLANDLGNLFSRTLGMSDRYFAGRVPPMSANKAEPDRMLRERVDATLAHYREEMTRWNFHRALMAIWELINHANKYIDGMEPWRLAKDPAQRERLSTIMRHLLEVNRIVAVLLAPVMPTTSEKVLERLGIPRRAHELRLDVDTRWGTLVEGKPVVKGEALFPRIDAHRAGAGDEPPGKTREAGAAGPAAPAAGGQRDEAPPAAAAAIPMEAFKKVDLRVGVVRHAEKIPNSDKLLRLLVDVGEERPVVAGIARTHTPEDLVGKQVVVVANLEPIRLMGVESRGMVLAVRDAKGLALLTTERPVVPGLPVS